MVRAGLLVPCLCTAWLPAQAAAHPEPFGIHCIDAATGRGVPLVELRTVHEVRFVSDSDGWCAIDEPDLLGRRVWFHAKSHGYEVSADGFGYRGAAFECVPGGRVELRLTRTQVAERLYRVTGAGVFRDSERLGLDAPFARAAAPGGVFGQDSVQAAPYDGRIFWFWGDTNRAAYPLGNFAVAGATSRPLGSGGLPPDVGVALEYFVGDDGFARRLCPIDGPGPVWIFGLATVGNGDGETLVCHYARMKDLGTPYEHGIAAWNDDAERFDKLREFPLDAPLHPFGSPLRVRDAAGRWLVFCDPYPTVRVPATVEGYATPTRYEAFTPVVAGARWSDARAELDRDDAGALRSAWRADTAAMTPERATHVPGGVAWQGLRDVETGAVIRGHGGTVHWNPYRKRFVMIALEAFGRSPLGEVWFAEADTVLGPWGYARRVVTHDAYSFYNVVHHAFFDRDGGRHIHFEGTYTATFSGNPDRTPRYDYNQVMYRLDLADPRLALPVPVYEVHRDGRVAWRTGPDVAAAAQWADVVGVPFHAWPAAGEAPDAVAVDGIEGFRVVPATATATSASRAATVELVRARRDGAEWLFTADDPRLGARSTDDLVVGRVFATPDPHPPLWPDAVEVAW